MSDKLDIKIKQGSSWQMQLRITDHTGTPLDLTEYEVRSQIRETYTSQAFIPLSASIDDAPNGRASLFLTALDTEAIDISCGVYDVELASGSYVSRIIEGAVHVSPEVTK